MVIQSYRVDHNCRIYMNLIRQLDHITEYYRLRIMQTNTKCAFDTRFYGVRKIYYVLFLLLLSNHKNERLTLSTAEMNPFALSIEY